MMTVLCFTQGGFFAAERVCIMRIVWNDRSWRWFESASAYTQYSQQMAELLLERIPRRGTLCDIGCGAALVDAELAPHLQHICCVDISPEILQHVEHHMQALGIQNVSTLCGDGMALEGQWDTVMALFHGGTASILKYFSLAKERLILAVHQSHIGHFGPESHKVAKCASVQATKAFLDEIGIHYHLTEHSLEYGQPLQNLADAKDFICAYTTPMTDKELQEYMEQHLVSTGREDFPYYLPKKKVFGLFVIRRDENETL